MMLFTFSIRVPGVVTCCMRRRIFDIILGNHRNTGGRNVEQVALLNRGLPKTLSKAAMDDVVYLIYI